MSFKSILWNGLKFISSLSFSISLFLLLASVSILGTVIEQEQSLDYYKLHYPISNPVMLFVTWQRIIFWGLNHVYSTYWFLLLLSLFFLSLLLCTLSTQLPILKYSRQWNFLYRQESLEKKSLFYKLQSKSFMNLIYTLNLNNYYVFHKGKGLYAYKGLLGRIAPIFVHISIIITFFGFILRMTNGFVLQEMIPNGELFHSQNVTTSGNFSFISNNITGKVNDFFITFNNDNSIKQFFSNISLVNNKGEVLFQKYISVNSPLRFKDITIYQTDWQINAIRMQVGNEANKFIVKALRKVSLNNISSNSVWFCDLIFDSDHRVSIVVPDLLDNLFIYDRNGFLVAVAKYGTWNIIYGVPILFKDLIASTGLQIKSDPGILLSYFGFFVLMISIITSYISYSQIWANQQFDTISFGGSTNRALLSFENEVVDIYKKNILLL